MLLTHVQYEQRFVRLAVVNVLHGFGPPNQDERGDLVGNPECEGVFSSRDF